MENDLHLYQCNESSIREDYRDTGKLFTGFRIFYSLNLKSLRHPLRYLPLQYLNLLQ